MSTIDLHARATNYAATYLDWPAGWPRVVEEQGRPVLYATWLIGNDYQNKSTFYGAYPKGYSERVHALYPEVTQRDVLHAFSGSLPAGEYTRLDCLQEAELRGDVCEVALLTTRKFPLILADPPYSEEDAVKYQVKMVDRRRAIAGLAEVAEPGAHLVWLDTVWPMHSKEQWVTVGWITIVRSTNHRVRMVTIFERQGAAL